LRPNANTVLILRKPDALVDLNKTSTKVLSSLSNLGICHPLVLVSPSFGRWDPRASTQASIVGSFASCNLKKVMDGADIRVVGGQKLSVAESPASVDGAASRALRTGDGNTVWRARRRNGTKLDLERSSILGGSHCEVYVMACGFES
jgi:hypothetical protein